MKQRFVQKFGQTTIEMAALKKSERVNYAGGHFSKRGFAA